MSAYRRILAAIDLTQDSRAVAGRACDIARSANGSVQLLHVLEIVPIEPMSDTLGPVMQIDQQLLLRTREGCRRLPAVSRPAAPRARSCVMPASRAAT
jgi:universal stress protein A